MARTKKFIPWRKPGIPKNIKRGLPVIKSSPIVDKTNPIKIEKIVSGSCILGEGFGERVLNKITDKYPTIFTEELGLNSEKLNEI